ncbi:MAG TPA: phosphotransferase [Lacipirellula sp.]
MQSTIEYAPAVRDADLHQFVSAALTDCGEARHLASIERQASEYSSSFFIEEVTAVFTDGSRLPLIFKNLGSDGLLTGARQARVLQDHNPAREIVVYRQLLSRAKLGTAICYAASADRTRRRYWLLLGKTCGSDLARVGDFAAWLAAARWLAEAHCRLTEAAHISGAGCLLRYDAGCFHRWIDDAERALRRAVVEGRAVADIEIKRLLERSRMAADLASGAPAEVIHGEFYPSNILIEDRCEGPRVCVIDWETAGMGPALLDLAALMAGNWSVEQQGAIASAYFAARDGRQGPPEHTVDPNTALRCCRLLLAMKWIGLWTRWQPPPEHRYDWLDEALRLAQVLSHDRDRTL